MIDLGLTAAERSNFHTLLCSSHRIGVSLQILDLSHNWLSDISGTMLSGQVNIDYGRDIIRSASLTLMDPYYRLGIDSLSPADGALFLDRMIRISYVVWDPMFTKKYVIPVFCGPITKVDRDWVTVSVECQGKEIIALGNAWKAKTYAKGARRTSVIVDMLRYQTGETKLSIPNLALGLPSNLAMSTEHKPWISAKKLAAGMGYQLFYDGRGVARMRAWPRTTSWVYSDGNGGSILSKPQSGYDLDNLVNAVRVIGTQLKGKKKVPLIVNRVAPSSHPLSPWRLGRNGVPRYFWTEIKDDNVDTVAEANKLGDTHLERGLIEPITCSFDALAIPHLEEGDLYRVQSRDFVTTAAVRQMTIPLSADGKSSVGFLKNTRPSLATLRRNRR